MRIIIIWFMLIGAGELLHDCGPSIYLLCKEFDKGVLSSIRHHLKKHNYCDFDYLLDGLKKLSTVSSIVYRYGSELSSGLSSFDPVR